MFISLTGSKTVQLYRKLPIPNSYLAIPSSFSAKIQPFQPPGGVSTCTPPPVEAVSREGVSDAASLAARSPEASLARTVWGPPGWLVWSRPSDLSFFQTRGTEKIESQKKMRKPSLFLNLMLGTLPIEFPETRYMGIQLLIG